MSSKTLVALERNKAPETQELLRRLLVMKKLISAALAASLVAHAANNYPISAAASVSTISSTIASAAAAPGPNTVTFAAGNYVIDSPIALPCPLSALAIQGATPPGAGTAWPVTPTSILTSTLTGNWAFSGTACSVGTTFRYLQFNGGQPSGGGGGFLYVPPGMNNLTVSYNYFYGNQALVNKMPVPDPDSFIWLDGSPTTARTQNTTITWNRFGTTDSGDCSAVMHLYGQGNFCSSSGYGSGNSACLYQDASSYNVGGGGCAAVGVHVNTDNLLISNNSIATQEQGVKLYEDLSSEYTSTNVQINNNDFSGIHRIGVEAQQNNGNTTLSNNDFHDPILPGFGQWALSLPQSAISDTNNVLIANVATGNDINGQPGYYSGDGVELWGNGTSSNNLVQGLWDSGIQWGFGNSPWSINNNIIQLTNSTSAIGNEEKQSNPPSQSGNLTSQTVSAVASVAPAISPSGGLQAFPLTVRFTDEGNTSGAGPQGNTGIWYTTDGSNPVPGGGTAKYSASGGTCTLQAAATVKAVGMWGALNQPTSYPSGYGYVPSPVISAVFKGGSGPRLVSAYLVSEGGVKSIPVGKTLQFIAHGVYSDGTSAILPDSEGNVVTAWNTSDHAVAKISTLGHVTATGVGTATIEGFIGNLKASTSEVAVTPIDASKVLVSAYLVSDGGAKSIPVGKTLQFIAHGVYSDGTSAVLPDPEGNAVTAWNTSNHNIAKISSLGHVTAMGVGTATIEGFIGNLKASTSEVAVTPIVAPSVQPAAVESPLAPRIESPSGSIPAVPGSPIGDQFLGPLWKVFAPAGGSASISNGHLFLSVPGGSNHDTLLPSNQAVRAVQAIGDADFDVSIKIDSEIEAGNADTSQGLMVMSDHDAFITFALTTDGTNIGLVARTVNAGVTTTVLEDTNFNQYQNPMYLRLGRSGDAYMASYSTDGLHWTQATSFTDAGTYTSIGPFDSNYNNSPQNAVPVVMSVDWFNVER